MRQCRMHARTHYYSSRQVSQNDALLSSEARRLIMASSTREKNAFTAWKFRHYFVSISTILSLWVVLLVTGMVYV